MLDILEKLSGLQNGIKQFQDIVLWKGLSILLITNQRGRLSIEEPFIFHNLYLEYLVTIGKNIHISSSTIRNFLFVKSLLTLGGKPKKRFWNENKNN